jgi:hypothetical protein
MHSLVKLVVVGRVMGGVYGAVLREPPSPIITLAPSVEDGDGLVKRQEDPDA